jgi:hypothetical protein
VHLVANTRYYIEMVHHEGTGGDYAGATFKLINDVDPANGTATRLTGSAVGVLTPPATVLNVTELPTNVTATALQPAYFRIAATNDNGIPITYQWRRSNGSGAMTNIPGATAQWYGLVASASDNGAVFDCVASQPGQPALNKTNSATLTVNAGTFTPGLINYERWSNQPNNAGALTTIQSGQSGPANVVVTTTNAYNIGDVADNYAQRLTGVFIAPSNGNYVFFVSGNDDADVFLNPTGDQPAGKVQIAEQLGSADSRYQWQEDDTPGDALQQRSDTYTNALGVAPYPTGIPLTGGNRYYLEAVHRAGGGDSYLGVTFAPYSADSSTVPTNGTPSVLTGNHIGYYSAPSKPVITMTRNGSNLNISWSPAGGALKSSPNVGAAMNTWTTLSTTNPATIPIGTGDLFMRVEQ